MNSMKIYFFVILCVVGSSFQQDGIPDMITRFIDKCSKQGGLYGIINCMTERSLKMVLKASEQRSLQIFPGLEIISNSSESQRIGRMLNSHDLPIDPKKKQEVLLDLLINATSRFIFGSVLQVRLPENTAQGLARALEESRDKKKKLDPIKLGFGAIMFTLVPIMLGGIGFISAKALVIGKIALVLSIILFVQGFFSGGRNMLPISYGYGIKPVYGYNGYNTRDNTPSTSYGYGTNTLGGWNQQDGYPYARSLDEAPTVSN